MAVPKKRMSKSKTRSRRAAAWRVDPTPRSVCDQCGAVKLSHRVCANCGWYKGRQAIEVE